MKSDISIIWNILQRHKNITIILFNISQGLVAVGGSRDENNYDISIDDKESKAILERCCKICPSLKVMKKCKWCCLLLDYYLSKCSIIAPFLVVFPFIHVHIQVQIHLFVINKLLYLSKCSIIVPFLELFPFIHSKDKYIYML